MTPITLTPLKTLFPSKFLISPFTPHIKVTTTALYINHSHLPGPKQRYAFPTLAVAERDVLRSGGIFTTLIPITQNATHMAEGLHYIIYLRH